MGEARWSAAPPLVVARPGRVLPGSVEWDAGPDGWWLFDGAPGVPRRGALSADLVVLDLAEDGGRIVGGGASLHRLGSAQHVTLERWEQRPAAAVVPRFAELEEGDVIPLAAPEAGEAWITSWDRERGIAEVTPPGFAGPADPATTLIEGLAVAVERGTIVAFQFESAALRRPAPTD